MPSIFNCLPKLTLNHSGIIGCSKFVCRPNPQDTSWKKNFLFFNNAPQWSLTYWWWSQIEVDGEDRYTVYSGSKLVRNCAKTPSRDTSQDNGTGGKNFLIFKSKKKKKRVKKSNNGSTLWFPTHPKKKFNLVFYRYTLFFLFFVNFTSSVWNSAARRMTCV